MTKIVCNNEAMKMVLGGQKWSIRRPIDPQPSYTKEGWDLFGFKWQMNHGPVPCMAGHTLATTCPLGHPGEVVELVDANGSRFAKVEIRGLTIERVQDVSRGELLGEGAPDRMLASQRHDDIWDWYKATWDRGYEKKGLGWKANPWVYSVKFTVIVK